MDGITFEQDKKTKRKYVKISLEKLEQHQEDIEDLLDSIIAEARKEDKTISLDELTSRLVISGKL